MKDINYVLSIPKKKQGSSYIIFLPFLFVIALSVTTSFVSYNYLTMQIASSEKESKRIKNESDKIMKQIADIEASNKLREYMIQIIDTVSQNTIESTTVFNELAMIMPKDLSISDYELNDNAIHMTGVSESRESIAYFLNKLRSFETFDKISIHGVDTSDKEDDKEISLYKFSIRMKITNYNRDVKKRR